MNVVASLFNLQGPDLLVILVIVLLLFGAKRLPELARGLGQAVNEFGKAKDNVQRELAKADEPPVTAPPQAQPFQAQAPAPAAPAPAAPAAPAASEQKPVA